MLDETDKEILLKNYKLIKKQRERFDNVIAEKDFIENIEFISYYKSDFWDIKENSSLLENIKMANINNEYSVGKKLYAEKVRLSEIIGTFMHMSYYGIPWIMAVAMIKRFKNNFPKTEKDKIELFDKMRNNNFNEKLQLVKIDNKYYIYEGHNRIIIARCLGLEYIKADIYEVL